MSGWHMWLLWILGGGLVLVGTALLVRSVLWDRARGRLRCPKCWYDMSSLAEGSPGPFTCPECGAAHKSQRRLRKTRRRYRIAMAALVITALGAAAMCAPSVSKEDPLASVPTFAMRLALPLFAGKAAAEYTARTAGPPTSSADEETWSDHLAAWGAVQTLRAPGRAGFKVPRPGNRFTIGTTIPLAASSHAKALEVLSQVGPEARVARPEVLRVLRDIEADEVEREYALEVLLAIRTQQVEQTARELEAMIPREIEVGKTFALRMLLAMGEPAVPAFERTLARLDPDAREVAGDAMIDCRFHPCFIPAVIAQLNDVSEPFSQKLYTCVLLHGRIAAAHYTSRTPRADATQGTVEARRAEFIRRAAIRSLGPKTALAALEDPDPAVRTIAINHIHYLRTNRRAMLEPILDALERETDAPVRREFADLLEAWGLDDQRAARLVEQVREEQAPRQAEAPP